jgi:hypothetical protein
VRYADPSPKILPGALALGLSAVIAVVLFASANLDQRLSLVTSSGHFYIVSVASFVFVRPCIAAVASFYGGLRSASSYRES